MHRVSHYWTYSVNSVIQNGWVPIADTDQRPSELDRPSEISARLRELRERDGDLPAKDLRPRPSWRWVLFGKR